MIAIPRIRWIRVITAACAVVVLSFAALIAAATVYAFVLAIEARGSPDQALIAQFSKKVSLWLIPLTQGFSTFLISMIVARKTPDGAIHGSLIGVVVCLLYVAMFWVCDWRLHLWDASLLFLAVELGWSGGLLGQRRAQAW